MNMSCKICMGVTVAFVLAAASPAFAQATAEITILVPADAELFFNGAPTAQRGTERLFVTPLHHLLPSVYARLRGRVE